MILCNKKFHVAVLGILVPCQHGDWLCIWFRFGLTAECSFGSAVFCCPCYFLLSWPVVGVLFPCPFRYCLCRGLLFRLARSVGSCWYVVKKKKL